MPCISALQFLLVCRIIYRACDDWTVWRDVLRSNTHGLARLPSTHVATKDGWKRYVIAVAKAARPAELQATEDLMLWLPHIAILGYPDLLLPRRLIHLSRFCDQAISRISNYSPSSSVLDDWELAQTTSFVLSVASLSLLASQESPGIPNGMTWPDRLEADSSGVPRDHQGPLWVREHAVANRVVGIFHILLRSALTLKVRVPGSTFVGIFPPTSRSIPFAELMELCVPFTSMNVTRFSGCHLSAMTEPGFITGGEWTGYLGTHSSSTSHFIEIGGRYCDRDDCIPVGAGEPMHVSVEGEHFERTVRFEVEGDCSGSQYKVQSNRFFSETMLHQIEMQVDRRTGQLKIASWARYAQERAICRGIVTPFGIVAELVGGVWLWLWRVEWGRRVYEGEE